MNFLRATGWQAGIPALHRREACTRCVACCIIALGCIMGCGRPRPLLVRVEGTVTLDGNPLGDATVVMVPTDSPDRGEARAVTDGTGRFDMVHDLFRDAVGVPAGHYRLVVSAFRFPSDGTAQPIRLVPGRFGDPRTSGLALEIASGSTGETVTVALKSSGEPGTVVR